MSRVNFVGFRGAAGSDMMQVDAVRESGRFLLQVIHETALPASSHDAEQVLPASGLLHAALPHMGSHLMGPFASSLLWP